jgi:hypothetical protein
VIALARSQLLNVWLQEVADPISSTSTSFRSSGRSLLETLKLTSFAVRLNKTAST